MFALTFPFVSLALSTKPVKIFTDSVAITPPQIFLSLHTFHLTLNFLPIFLKDLLSFSKFATPTAIAASVL